MTEQFLKERWLDLLLKQNSLLMELPPSSPPLYWLPFIAEPCCIPVRIIIQKNFVLAITKWFFVENLDVSDDFSKSGSSQIYCHQTKLVTEIHRETKLARSLNHLKFEVIMFLFDNLNKYIYIFKTKHS